MLLSDIIYLFQACTIKLYNYRDIKLPDSFVPVLLEGNDKLRFEDNPKFRWHFGSHCLALFYLLPDVPDMKPSSNNLTTRHRQGQNDYYIRELKQVIDTRSRYDILVDLDNRALQMWGMLYGKFLENNRNNYGLILNVENRVSIWSEEIRLNIRAGVANRFMSTRERIVGQTINLKNILSKGGYREYLEKKFQHINDIRNNPKVKWNLISASKIIFDVSMLQQAFQAIQAAGVSALQIKNEMEKGTFSFRSAEKYLKPTATSLEGLENYVLAYTILGANASHEEGYGKASTILFDSPQGTIMKSSGPKSIGFITCAGNKFSRIVSNGYLDVLFELISIYEPKIYLGLLFTYLLPCCVLGILYHGMLRKRIQEKYWIKWHPFTWGMRALIWQAGDRRWNNNRFGFMIWLVVPWLLVSILISYGFRGRNLYVLMRPSSWGISENWVSFERLLESKIPILTDIAEIAKRWNGSEAMHYELVSYEDIGRFVNVNEGMAYVTYEGRANAIANRLGGCGNNRGFGIWRKVSRGKVPAWDLPNGMDNVNGWEVYGWGDVRLLKRLRWMERESGIVTKWREVMTWFGKNNDMLYWNWEVDWVMPATMIGNIRFLFMTLLGSLIVAFVCWICERIWFLIYTKPMRKRCERKAKQMDVGGRVIRIESTAEGVDLEGVCMDGMEGEVGNDASVVAGLAIAADEQQPMGQGNENPVETEDTKHLTQEDDTKYLKNDSEDDSVMKRGSVTEASAQDVLAATSEFETPEETQGEDTALDTTETKSIIETSTLCEDCSSDITNGTERALLHEEPEPAYHHVDAIQEYRKE